MLNCPARGPSAFGVKVTAIVHFAPGSRPFPQLVSLESIAKSPCAENPSRDTGALPLFESVIFLNALVTPTVPNTVRENVSCFGEKESAPDAAEPSGAPPPDVADVPLRTTSRTAKTVLNRDVSMRNFIA